MIYLIQAAGLAGLLVSARSKRSDIVFLGRSLAGVAALYSVLFWGAW